MKKNFLLIILSVLSFGSIHADISWNLSDDGTLTLSGTEMPNADFFHRPPWHSDRNRIFKVVIENGMTNIGQEAFYDCNRLTSITIPESVTSIGTGAFWDCSRLTSINIPESVTSIGGFAFYGCSMLTSITIPNSVTSIGGNAFTGSNLISVTIPNSIVKIEDYAFAGCHRLTSITIPNSVTSIGYLAFQDCYNLNSITIPNSVTYIGNGAFDGCSALSSVTNLATTPQEISIGTFFEYGTLHVLPGCKAKYEAADYWKNFTIVEDATTGINAVESPTTISADKIFSISGHQLDKTKKGLNIINGKKILVE
jgi:hypothetical protein